MTLASPELPDVSIAEVDRSKVKLDVQNLDFYYGKTRALKSVSIPFEAKAVTAFSANGIETPFSAWVLP